MNSIIEERRIDEIDYKKNELTKKYNDEIYNLKQALKNLENDEIPEAVRNSLLDEIGFTFTKKWQIYKEEMNKLDNQYY